MFVPNDYTEQSATWGATGAVMQGALELPCVSITVHCTNHLFTDFLQGTPANPKCNHQWVKRKSTKATCCQLIFDAMPKFFTHHDPQIEFAQHDGKKTLLSVILRDSGILNLAFDFPENYTHINQVCSMEHVSFALSCFQHRSSLHSLYLSAYESNALV